jgi:hypothetical protein
MDHPDDFLNIIFHDASSIGDDLALCAGFERGKLKWTPKQGQFRP